MPTRRQFLDTLLYTSLSAIGVALAAPIPFYLLPPQRRLRRLPVVAGLVEALHEGEGLNAVYSGTPVTVLRVEGALRAFSRVCPHRYCPVNWNPARKEFHCPCHGAVFDIEGRPVSGPAKKSLERVAVNVDTQGRIVLGG